MKTAQRMKKRILLVGNRSLCLEQLRKKLERQDYSVRRVADVRDAGLTADLRNTDWLLVDLDIPQPEREAILARALDSHPALRVVGLTERTDLRTTVFGSTLSAVVQKPIDFAHLCRVMTELVTGRQKGRWEVDPVPQGVLAPQNAYPAVYSGWGIND